MGSNAGGNPTVTFIGLNGRVYGRIRGFGVEPDGQRLGLIILRNRSSRYVLEPGHRVRVSRIQAATNLVDLAARLSLMRGEVLMARNGGPATPLDRALARGWRVPDDCHPFGRGRQALYLMCNWLGPSPGKPLPTIERLDRRGHRVVLARQPLHAYGMKLKAGSWEAAALSPDGLTVLAQWSAECESPTAFFLSAAGGAPRAVTGEVDVRNAPESVALGWSNNGKAIVDLPEGGCGNGSTPPGVYLIDPMSGKRSLLWRTRDEAVLWHS